MLKWVIILLFFISFVSEAQDRHFVLWNKNGVEIAPWKKVTIDVAEKIHFTPQNNTINLKYGELSVSHEPKNWLDYGAGFRVSYLNLQNGNWLNENRPMAFVNLSKELKEFELCFSNRVEYRTYKELENHFRHKQSLKLNFPALAEWGMQFYVSEESYFKMNGGGTNLARFQSGVTAFEKEWFAMKVYYILEKARVIDTWLSGDILGLNLSFYI